jgi:hypothetical protein
MCFDLGLLNSLFHFPGYPGSDLGGCPGLCDLPGLTVREPPPDISRSDSRTFSCLRNRETREARILTIIDESEASGSGPILPFYFSNSEPEWGNEKKGANPRNERDKIGPRSQHG